MIKPRPEHPIIHKGCGISRLASREKNNGSCVVRGLDCSEFLSQNDCIRRQIIWDSLWARYCVS